MRKLTFDPIAINQIGAVPGERFEDPYNEREYLAVELKTANTTISTPSANAVVIDEEYKFELADNTTGDSFGDLAGVIPIDPDQVTETQVDATAPGGLTQTKVNKTMGSIKTGDVILVVVYGKNIPVRYSKDVSANDKIYTSATKGKLSDTSTSAHEVDGITPEADVDVSANEIGNSFVNYPKMA